MATEIGELRARLTAESQGLKTEIQTVKREISELGNQGKKTATDIKSMDSAFGQLGSSKEKISRLTGVLDNVNSKIEIQRKKLAELKQSYDSTFDGSSRKNKLQEQIANTEAGLLRLTQHSDETAKKIWALEDGAKVTAASLNDLSSTLKKLGVSSSEIESLERSFNKVNPKILQGQISDITAEMKRFGATEEEINKVTKAIERSATGAYSAKNELKQLGLAYAGLAAAMGAIMVKSVQTAAEFEQSMANVKAISQATGAEFESLRKQALNLGATTKYTSAQVADAQALLAQAGFKTKDIISSLPGVLSLASAGQTDLATTADIAASALNGFGLKADQAGRVADVLAKSSIDTNADITDLGFAMKYVAPVAANMGVSIEEAAAAVGELSNAGIKGEMAGTQLRAILLALASPSKEAAFYMDKLGVSIKDSAGNIKPLSTIIGDLQVAYTKLTQVQQADVAATLVGREAASGFLTLISQGKDTLDNYTESLQNAGGTAQQVADTQMDTLKGATLELQSALEAAGISMGDKLAPAVRQVAEFITELLQDFTSMNPTVQTAIVGFVAATAAVLGLVAAVGALSIAFTALNVSFPVLGAITLAIGLVSAGVAALTAESNQAAEAVKKHDDAQKSLNETLSKSPLKNTIEDLEALKEKSKELQEVLERRAEIEERIKQLGDNGDQSLGGIVSELDVMREALKKVDDEINGMGYENIEDAKAKFEDLNAAVKASVPALMKAQEAEVAKLATDVEHIDKMNALKKQYDDLSGKQKLSEQQTAQLASVVEALTREYPGLISKLDEENQWHITNRGSLEDLISAERQSVSASAQAAKDRLNNWKVETEAKLKLAQAQINALEKVEKFNFAGSAVGKRLPGETGKGLEIIGDMIVEGVKRKAQSNANDYQKTLNQIDQDISKITAGAYDKFKTNPTGKGIDLSKPEKEKKAKKATGKSAEEKAKDLRKEAYDAAIATVQYQAEMYDWTADQQIKAYEKLRKQHQQHLKESVEDERQMNLQIKRLQEDSIKSQYDFSNEWIGREERRMEESGKTESEIEQMKIDAWTRVRNRYAKDSEFYKQADEKLYQARKNLAKLQEQAAKDETKARGDLIKEYQKQNEDLVKTELKAIDKAKKAELDAIDERKKAYVNAQDEKIAAIDALLHKEEELNVDADYETQLAEKIARKDKLSTAVSPEGRKELADVTAEIERMQLEHSRELRKRDLEDQKVKLKEEKDEKEKAFDDEKKAAEDRYDALTEAMKDHQDDIQFIENAIKDFRIGVNQEANDQILSDLDKFVNEYRNRMAEITSLSVLVGSDSQTSQASSNLIEYNANKDAWEAAKARGDKEEMARLTARNEELRKLYGIDRDTGKLPSFDVGGVVPGPIGDPMEAIIHGGEVIFNPGQFENMFRHLTAPVSSPAVDRSPAPAQHIENHFDMSIDHVEVVDRTDAEIIYTERERTARRLTATGGGK